MLGIIKALILFCLKVALKAVMRSLTVILVKFSEQRYVFIVTLSKCEPVFLFSRKNFYTDIPYIYIARKKKSSFRRFFLAYNERRMNPLLNT